MEIHSENAPGPRVKVNFSLGSETFSVSAAKGILSEQLASMKEESMNIFKEYITKHNVPNDVPDEPLEGLSEDDEEIRDKSHVKSKKTKIN